MARDFREPHRAALDYLNSISTQDHNFFGVQVELYRIGSSPMAPQFSLVAKPNDWSKALVARTADTAERTQLHGQWVEYWTGYFTYAEQMGRPLNRVPPREGWCQLDQLRSGDPSAAIWRTGRVTRYVLCAGFRAKGASRCSIICSQVGR